MSGDVPKAPSGMFPQANPEDRYPPDTQEAAARRKREAEEAAARRRAEPNPKHPATSFPHATEPAVADPDAVPSNIRQRAEVREREDKEFLRKHGYPSDKQFQQPGAASQQYDPRVDLESNPISEQTRLEMETGRKNAETRANRESGPNLEEQERLETEQLANAVGVQGEQLEARRKEEEERRKTWGDPPDGANRNTIAGAKDE